MEARIKTQEYNQDWQLEEVDLGEVPTHRIDLIQTDEYGHRFTYRVEGRTYHNCYVTYERGTPLVWRLIGGLFILTVTTGAGLLLSAVLRWLSVNSP